MEGMACIGWDGEFGGVGLHGVVFGWILLWH